jgi:hypothetical protein
MDTDNNTITLDLRVSCDVFWKYQLMLKVNCDEFVEPVAGNSNINCHTDAKTPVFSRLERHLCDAMIAHIHEDLAINNDEEKIQQLCEISNKFHVHGHTTRSLLQFQSNAPHADHGGCIYICTHC